MGEKRVKKGVISMNEGQFYERQRLQITLTQRNVLHKNKRNRCRVYIKKVRRLSPDFFFT